MANVTGTNGDEIITSSFLSPMVKKMTLVRGVAAAVLLIPSVLGAAAAEAPVAIAVPGETVIVTVHAVGAQIYECKPAADGKSAWQFREPIAALMTDGKTVGPHYAGPTWEIGDGAVVGKVAGKAPGAGVADIPWLKLDVVSRRGSGPIAEASTVQRINTAGGSLDGPCTTPGELRAAPYAADYVFLKKPK
jgi:hypothetical protein